MRDDLCSIGVRQSLSGVLAERLEHPKAGRVGAVRDDHRLVDERGEHFADIFIAGDCGHHLWHRLELEPSANTDNCSNMNRSWIVEQLVAPVERGTHRPMPMISPAATRCQQVRSVFEMADQFAEPDRSHPCRCQFDGKRDAVEMSVLIAVSDVMSSPANAGSASRARTMAIAVATTANVRGVRVGALLTGLSSVAKFGALAFVVCVAFLAGHPEGGGMAHFTAAGAPTGAGAFGLALISVLWAYDGFADLAFLGGEVVNPGRTIPRALIGGTLAIVAIYIGANAAYLWVLPIDSIARSPLIAADTMAQVFGSAGVTFVSVVVMVSTFGAVNADLLGAPRIFFAAADDGLFFRSLARVHPRFKTPHVSIVLSATLGAVFVLTGTFEQLADTFVLAIWPFYGFAVAGLYRLRRLKPDLPRPYRVHGYPVVPAVFVAAVLYLVGSAFVTDPMWTALTFGVILAGVPVYLVAFAGKPH